jgi:uncharacterized protein (TIGR02145 family)
MKPKPFESIKCKSIVIILSLLVLAACKEDDIQNSFEGDSGTFIDSRDNRVYRWVRIGDQIWMAENLGYTGDNGFIKYMPDTIDWATNTAFNGWCHHFNDPSNYATMGVLYQYEAAISAVPPGWHIPDENEFFELLTYLSSEGHSADGITTPDVVTDEGLHVAKSMATDNDWIPSSIPWAVGNGDLPELRNRSGLSIQPTSMRRGNGTEFWPDHRSAYFHLTRDSTIGIAAGFRLEFSDSKAHFWYPTKDWGQAVRCIKD